MAKVIVVGIKCDRPFDDIIEHFRGLGGDVILFDPKHVFGRDHILSAVIHAERAFLRGVNRSRSLITETILYAAGERQISKAIAKIRPADGCNELAAAVFDIDELCLDKIDAAVDDSLLECTPDKVKGTEFDIPGISPEDLAIEMVAMVDIQKQ